MKKWVWKDRAIGSMTHLPWVRVKHIYLQLAHSVSTPLVTARPIGTEAKPCHRRKWVCHLETEKMDTHSGMEPVLWTSNTRLPPNAVSFWKLEFQHNVKNRAIDSKCLGYTVLGQKGLGRGTERKGGNLKWRRREGAPWEEWVGDFGVCQPKEAV